MTSRTGDWAAALAGELRAEMGRQRLTLDEMAAKSGIPKVSVERYVNGKRDIPMSKFPQLCRALGVAVPEMITRVETALGRSDETGTARRSS